MSWDRNFAITDEDIPHISAYIRENQVATVLEVGPGRSTELFLRLGCLRIVSLEHNQMFAELAAKLFAYAPAVRVLLYTNDEHRPIPDSLVPKGERFDLGFVDGPGYTEPFSRMQTCSFIGKHCNAFFLHDSLRAGEQATIRSFVDRGWMRTDYATPRGLTLLKKAVDTP